MSLTVENGVVHGNEPSNYLSKEEHVEQQIKFTQRAIAGLQTQKKEEKQEGGLSDGRKRWFNREIDRKREKLRNLIEEVDN